jgi:hypothetical protein
MWVESARHQSQPSNKQNQHHQRIEETRWPEIDMHVGNNARKNEERARDRKKPSDDKPQDAMWSTQPNFRNILTA